MMYLQYCRIEARAGGVCCTDRAFIKACLSVIKKRARYSREFREGRHAWILAGLKQLKSARTVYKMYS